MSRPISESLSLLSETLGNCKTNLKEKEVADVDNIKISDVDEKIAEIKSGGFEIDNKHYIVRLKYYFEADDDNNRSYSLKSEKGSQVLIPVKSGWTTDSFNERKKMMDLTFIVPYDSTSFDYGYSALFNLYKDDTLCLCCELHVSGFYICYSPDNQIFDSSTRKRDYYLKLTWGSNNTKKKIGDSGEDNAVIQFDGSTSSFIKKNTDFRVRNTSDVYFLILTTTPNIVYHTYSNDKELLTCYLGGFSQFNY